MTWHTKYWDCVDQFYWTPSHLGLVSISQENWGDDPATITIPRHLVKNGGTLYTRRGTARENATRMLGLEETINHVFDITFAVAPDQVLAELFLHRLGFYELGPIERIGREVKGRYAWGDANVTQQDMFLASPSSVIGVELKLVSKTSDVQVLKYLALMVLEEKHSGPRDNLGLLYITPEKPTEALWRDAGASPDGTLPVDWVQKSRSKKLNKTLERLLDSDQAKFEAAASRLVMCHVTWRQLVDDVDVIIGRLDRGSLGDETLVRLLSGFQAAVRGHRGTGWG